MWIECVEGLGKRSRFTIVAYSDSMRVWNKKLQPATPAAKKKALEFVSGMQASGLTHTLSALKLGLEVKGADAIVLLSDGMPTESLQNHFAVAAHGSL